MKIALQTDNENYQKFAELVNIGYGFHSLTITSMWAGAKDATAEQTNFTCLLDATGIKNLKKLLGQKNVRNK